MTCLFLTGFCLAQPLLASAAPDITGIIAYPSAANSGDRITITNSVKNIGDGIKTQTTMAQTYLRNSSGTKVQTFENRYVNALNPEEESPSTLTPLLATTHPTGAYTICINSDYYNAVTDDADTTNNVVCGSPLYINVAPPVISSINGPTDPQPINSQVDLTAEFADLDVDDTHTAAWNWDDGTSSAGDIAAAGSGLWTVAGSHIYVATGVYTASLRVTDSYGMSDSLTYEYIVIYNPDGGFITGGGLADSPEGAYVADPLYSGTASFGFVSKYVSDAVPTGHTGFKLLLSDMKFTSTKMSWLVVDNDLAIYEGVGTINGVEGYGFSLSSIDGDYYDLGDPDTFRIQIWELDGAQNVIYDNMLGAPLDARPDTPITHGSIVIHENY